MAKPKTHPELAALIPRLDGIAGLDAAALDAEEIAILGRKSGRLNALLKSLAALDPAERREVGGQANALKLRFEEAFAARREVLRAGAARREAGAVDLTLPGRVSWTGGLHPTTQVTDEIIGIFRELGFVVATGPEAETEWHNFIALNFPPDHPAMDLHDTLYLETGERRDRPSDRRRGRSSGLFPADERRTPGGERRQSTFGRILLRTHTSPVQVRTMVAHPPPLRVVIPGMVYRNDPFDASHAPAFSQIEGLVVDEGISFVDLKGTLLHFARRFFSPSTKVRFRPSYFPFTEPSAEMDVECQLCHGGGCAACKQTGWMEILGCGMVHPRVFEHTGIDAETYTGFAFGMGPQRIAMQRFGLPDIRLLYDADMRVLGQFARGGR